MKPDRDARGADVALPRTQAKTVAITAEQHVIDRIHNRVEVLRERAEKRASDTNRQRSGSTFQAQYERDVSAFHHAARAHEFTLGDLEALAFGRIDATDGEVMYIGRRGVIDASGDVLLVDWRAPISEAFYQATAHDPRGLARRRTLVCAGRQLRDLDDEILDADAADRLGIVPVNGDGALIASLNRERTHQMQDIVATIQAEQDRIIRAPANGTLIVTGGPGTGKTVVALHRVASLLYRDRSRYQARGVLVIGPSQAFTAYTSRVLPALGETAVVQRPLAQLAPRGVTVEGWSPPAIGTITGSFAMIELARNVVFDALPAIPPETRFSVLGTSAAIGARELNKLRHQHLRALDPDQITYHGRYRQANDALLGSLFSVWRRARQTAGYTVTDTERSEFFELIPDMPQVKMLTRCFWPVLEIADVINRVLTGDADVARLAADILAANDAATLAAQWRDVGTFTVDDVGFLDETAALIGPAEAVNHRRDDDAAIERANPDTDSATTRFTSSGYRDFAHVVVDEAQDLTPMAWRCVARRGPYATWTVVGDLAQRSRTVQADTWNDVAQMIGRRQVEIHTLTVNYRTPQEIAEVAGAIVAARDPDHAKRLPRAIRRTGTKPALVVTDDVVSAVVHHVQRLLRTQDGTLAVIAPDDAIGELRAAVGTINTDRLRVLDARTVKGLEFDDVVIAWPERLLQAPLGHAQLYVATTRPTRTLLFVSRVAAPFPGSERCESVGHSRQA